MNGDGEALFERALVSEDEAFDLAAERLREPGERGTLEHNLEHADPVGRLMARVMLDWSDEAAGTDFDRARAYLDQVERRFANTVAGAPPVRGVVHTLSTTYGDRLAEFAALLLVKESQPASWRALSFLGYLERHPTPGATDALIRYAATTPVPELQRIAARVLATGGDPALAQKLAAERDRLARAGRQLPPALAALSSTAVA